MANTYTPKLNLAKPANGDVDWHIPINENFDILDTNVDSAAKTALVSGTTIDADKNWNGKSITNVNQFQAASANLTTITTSRYTLFPDTICYADNTEVAQAASPSGLIVKTAPPVPARRYGTVTVYYNQRTSSTSYPTVFHIYKNGVSVHSTSTSSTSYVDYVTNVNVAPGDVLALAFVTTSGETAYNSRFEIRAITLPGIVNSITW